MATGETLEDRRLLAAQLVDGGLQMEVVTAYNLVVDSNVESPSTYGPRSAFLGVTISNTGSSVLSDVVVNIGNLTNVTTGAGTPGVYPVTTIPASDPLRDYSGAFSFTHEGGVTDASRLIPSLSPGQTTTQYFLVSYPVTDASNNSVVGSAPVTADDLELFYDVWISAQDPADAVDGTRRVFDERKMTGRNEISAMANKIWPNSNGKVPDEYLDAFETSLGWRPSSTVTRIPGAEVSEGVWYDLGNVGFGFDNDGNFVPDRNAWLQPVGDPDLFDASAGRLVKCYGLLIIKLNDGTEQLQPFEDQMYFENINPNNTGAVGLVWYEYLPLEYGSTLTVSPYQEVASGYDNEKFNGDYGTSIPAIRFDAPPNDLAFDKTGPVSVSGGQAAFNLVLSNSSLVTPFGWPDQGLPAVIEDSIPNNTTYKAGSAVVVDVPAGATATIYYSTDNRLTWTKTEPAWTDTNGNSIQDPGEGTVTDVRWVLSKSLLNDTFEVSFGVLVPASYATTSGPVIVNTGSTGLLNGSAVLTDSHTVLVSGSLSLGDTVFRDDGAGSGGTAGDGVQNGTETGLANITLTLYYDADADGVIDAGDILWGTTTSNSSGAYSFSGLPAASYIVKADSNDADIPAGWNLSTDPQQSITLSATNVLTADFGFSPSVDVTKKLQGQSPVYEGSLITYSLEVANLLKGDGYAASQPQQHSLWLGTTSGTFSNTGNAAGDGTGTFASTSTDQANLRGTTPSVPAASQQTTPITHVEAVIRLYTSPAFRAGDSLTVEVTRNGVLAGTYTVARAVSGFSSAGNVGDVTVNLTGLGGWTWQNLTSATTGINVIFNKDSGSNAPTVFIDRMGFRVTTIAEQNRDGYVYWSDQSTTLKTGPSAGGEIQLLMPSLSAAVTDIANDYVNGFVYLGAGSTIYKVDGNGLTSASFTAGGSVTGMDVDAVGGWLYWTEGGNQIRRSSLNFTGASSSLVAGVSNVTALTIDPLGGRLYWSESGNQTVIIRSVRLVDLGSASPAVTTVLDRKVNSSGNSNIEDLEVDYAGGKLYFTDNSTGPDYIGVVDLNGGNAKKLIDLSASNPAPLGLAVDSVRGLLFWGDNTGVNRATLTGTGSTLIYSGQTTVRDVEVPNFAEQYFGSFDINKTLELVPLTDDYDPAELSYVSSSIAPASVDTTTGLITWSNVGPINPGASRTIFVTFRVLEPAGNSTDSSVINTASVAGAQLASGLSANDDSSSSTISVLPTGSVGNFVWRDTDGAGDQDAGEPGLEGITVELYQDLDADGTLDAGEPRIDTQVTDSSGAYLFRGLAPEDGTWRYLVRVNTAGLFGVTNTFDASSPLNSTSAVTMTNPAGAGGPTDDLLQDFGYSFTNNTRVYGTVWQDYDRDGTRDSGVDPGISGVTVSLFNASNVAVATTTTAADGTWNFYGIAPGSYTARVTTATLPSTGTWTQTSDPDATNDSLTPTGGTFTLAAGGVMGAYNFGYGLTGTSSIGDTVFMDWDGDNVLDAGDGDVGIPSVTVQLYLDLNSNGVLDLGSDPLVSSTVTDSSGGYLFSTLPAATWFVVVDESDPDFPPNVTESTDNPAKATLYSSVSLLTVDFGYQPFGDGMISGSVWDDDDFSETKESNEGGFPAVSVELWWDRFGTGNFVLYKTLATDSSGSYAWTGLPYGDYQVRVVSSDTDIPAGHVATTVTERSVSLTPVSPSDTADFGFAGLPTLGDTVYYDANRNGTQDAFEAGISGVVVRLFTDTNADGQPDGAALQTATTDAQGHFMFTQVNHTHAGMYYVVVVDTSTLPAALLNSGDPDRDGVAWTGTADAFPSADNSDSFISVQSSSYQGADFGYVPRGVVGDFVWLDLDADGVQDAGEQGIAGVTVTAFRAASSTTVTTQTDQDGRYSFANLADGVWTISISGSPLTGKQGSYDADGGDLSSTTVTITSGAISSPSIGSLDVDFGVRLGGAFSLSGTVATNDARSPGTADDVDNFADDGLDRDAGANDETELSRQVLYLYQIVSGSPVYLGSTQTDDDGNYVFSGLGTGDYRVVLSTASVELQNSSLTTTAATSPASAVDSFGKDTNSDGSIDVLTSVAQTVSIAGASVADVDFTFVSDVEYDYGDLPDSYSSTRLNHDGARHVIPAGGSSIWLGTAPDADVNGASGAFADGDDILGADDDDGVSVANIGGWTNGTGGGSLQVTVPSGQTGYLVGWIDFNHDDSLIDVGEFIISRWITGTGSAQTINFDIPAGTIGTTSESWLSRFRIFTEQPAFPLFSYEGAAVDGEVEDHLFSRPVGASIGDRVWVDSDGDGIQDTGERGLPGLLVTLRDASGNRITDQLTSNGAQDVDGDGVVDAMGYYRFTGLTATTDYRVTIAVPTGYTLSFDEDSGTSSPDGVVSVTDLEVTPQRSTADFGLQPLSAKISGIVFNDTNSATAGAFDAEDSRLAGVVVELWLDPNNDGDLSDGLQVGETTTSSSGAYEFSGVPSGRYVVIERDPATYTSVLDTDSLNDNRIAVSLTGVDSTGNNFLDVTTVIAYDVAVTKSNGSSSVVAGGTTTWSIVVTNNGPITATGVVVSDVQPSWISSWSWSGNSLTGQTGNLSDTISRLLPGASVTYTVVANVKSDATGASLTNTATVTAAGDTNSTNNSASDTDSATVQYDVSVTKTNGTTTVVPGATTTYTITVSNAGPSTATSVSVSDNRPSWITSWTWSGNGLTGQTGNLSNTISSLAPGSSVVYTVVATVSATATGGGLANTATVSGADDTDASNNTSTDTDSADPQCDVSVTKSNGGSTVVPGSTTTYTIVVSNSGPNAANSVTVTDNIPSWISSWTWSGNGLTGQTGNLTDTISSLASGASVTYTVVANVRPNATGSSLTNTVAVSASGDTNAANDSASDTDSADVQYDVSV
ncbi:MAG: SdrD B-like domain-containing protein, partial [Planctomyces sp.]